MTECVDAADATDDGVVDIGASTPQKTARVGRQRRSDSRLGGRGAASSLDDRDARSTDFLARFSPRRSTSRVGDRRSHEGVVRAPSNHLGSFATATSIAGNLDYQIQRLGAKGEGLGNAGALKKWAKSARAASVLRQKNYGLERSRGRLHDLVVYRIRVSIGPFPVGH